MADDPPICKRCDEEYTMDAGDEPTRYCDSCAHHVVDELRAVLRETLAWAGKAAQDHGEMDALLSVRKDAIAALRDTTHG